MIEEVFDDRCHGACETKCWVEGEPMFCGEPDYPGEWHDCDETCTPCWECVRLADRHDRRHHTLTWAWRKLREIVVPR